MPGYGFGYSALVSKSASSAAPPSPYGTLTTAWIAATGETDLTIIGALNTLETDLTTYGLTAKITGLYPFVGGTSTKHSYNFMNTAQYNLTFLGGWSHSSSGALANGVNGMADTGILPLSLNDFGFGFYGYKSTFESKCQMGAESGSGVTFLYGCFNSGGTMLSNINGTGQKSTSGTYTNVNGFYSVSRTDASTVLTRAVNATASFSVSGGTLQTAKTIYIGANNYASTGDAHCNTEFRGSFVGNGLTATESGNLKTAFDTFNTTLGRHVGVPIVSDADAQAFLNAAVITDTTQASAINTLVTGLKADGLWTKMKAIYPFVGGTASTHKWNLKDPQDTDGAFRLVFSGGLTHDSNGIKGNATNAYYDTKFNPSVHLTSSTGGSAFLYCNNSVADNGADLAANQSGVNTRFQVMASYAGSFYASMLATNLYSASNTTTVGFFGATREPSNTTSFYAVKDTNSYSYSDSFANPNSNVAGLCVCTDSTSFAYFTGRRHSFSCMGEGLTTTQAQNLRTAVIAFNTTLGR